MQRKNFTAILYLLCLLVLFGCVPVAGRNELTADGGMVNDSSEENLATNNKQVNNEQGDNAQMNDRLAALESEIETTLKTFQEKAGFSGALLLAHDGDIVYSQGIGMADQAKNIANAPQTRFRIASITKTFTAAAIMLLQEMGKLSVQDPVCQYIADCPIAWEPITIHHLLSHTGGIVNLQDLPIYEELVATHSPASNTLQAFINEPLNFVPGAQYGYSNSGYVVLGLIIEQVSGQPYADFLQEYIFTPLGMQNSGYDHNRDDLAVGYVGTEPADFIDMSVTFAAGGLYSTVEDLYKWDQAFYTDQLLSAETRAIMFTGYEAMPAPPPQTDYGYGWIVSRGLVPGKLVIAHDGGIRGFSSLILRLPEDRITLILLSNQEGAPVLEITPSVLQLLLEGS